MDGRLTGRRALVTGAGSGIGRAVAIAFAREGAHVALVGRTEAKLRETEGLIGQSGARVRVIPADLARESEVESAVLEAEDAFGGLDTIAGVAGVEPGPTGDARVDRLELEVWQSIIASNLTGMFLTLKHGARALIRNGGGSIIVTGSPTGIRGHGHEEFGYSSSKAGTHGMVRVVAGDLATEGIRVNGVIPGFIDTPLAAPFFTEPGSRAEAEGSIPLGRAGRPDEVAAIYVWLASDEASYATGAFFVIDGGQIAMC